MEIVRNDGDKTVSMLITLTSMITGMFFMSIKDIDSSNIFGYFSAKQHGIGSY